MDNYKDSSNKNEMVNNGNSDDNNRNEENKNNSHNHTIDCNWHCTVNGIIL